MTATIRFRIEADVIYEGTVAYRRLSPTDRPIAILDLIGAGAAMLEHSPHRDVAGRLREAHEAEWQ